MPGAEQYGEGLRIAAGAGGTGVHRESFLPGGEGEGSVQPSTLSGPWQHRRGGVETEPGVARPRVKGWLCVSLGKNRIPTAAQNPGSVCSEPHNGGRHSDSCYREAGLRGVAWLLPNHTGGPGLGILAPGLSPGPTCLWWHHTTITMPSSRGRSSSFSKV